MDSAVTVPGPVSGRIIDRLKGWAIGPARIRGAHEVRGRAAMIPPATPGSVGDAAMLSAAIAELRNRGYHTVDLFYGKHWPLDEAVDMHVRAERFFYGGSRLQELALLRRMKRYQFVCMIGADVIDGAYNPASVTRRLSLLRAASLHGCATAILGASYNASPEETTRSALASLAPHTAVYARDPVSHARLSAALCRPISQAADVAFLVRPLPDHSEAQRIAKWAGSRRQAGQRILAVNANYLHAAKVPGFREGLAVFIRRAIEANIALVLVPHDSRTNENDRMVLQRAVPPDMAGQVTMLETESAGAIKACLTHADGLFTGRLHAMILAMGMGTPAIGMAYQGKFEGLLQLFGLEQERLLTTPEALAATPDDAVTLAVDMLARSTALRIRIDEALPRIREMSRRNFALA